MLVDTQTHFCCIHSYITDCTYMTATLKIIVSEVAGCQVLLTLMVKMRIATTFFGSNLATY